MKRALSWVTLLCASLGAVLLLFRFVDAAGRYVLHLTSAAEPLLVLLALVACLGLAGRAAEQHEREGA